MSDERSEPEKIIDDLVSATQELGIEYEAWVLTGEEKHKEEATKLMLQIYAYLGIILMSMRQN
jgi:predicted nucleic acid-binding protein